VAGEKGKCRTTVVLHPTSAYHAAMFPVFFTYNLRCYLHVSSDDQVSGCSIEKKKLLLSMKYWLFHRDPKIKMAYHNPS